MPGSMELRKKRVLVVGLARTGVATALFCAGHYAIVTATETRAESELGEAPAKLRAAGGTLGLGGDTEKKFFAPNPINSSPRGPAGGTFLVLAPAKGNPNLRENKLGDPFLGGKQKGNTGI